MRKLIPMSQPRRAIDIMIAAIAIATLVACAAGMAVNLLHAVAAAGGGHAF